MTSPVGRLYALGTHALRLLPDLGGVAAHPWRRAARAGPARSPLSRRASSACARRASRSSELVERRWAATASQLAPAATRRSPTPAQAQLAAAAAPLGSRRHAAARSRSRGRHDAEPPFRAMGTDIELLRRRRPRPPRARRGRGRVPPARGAPLALPRRTRSSRGSTATGTLEAGPDLLEVVELALDARERTGGRFDPTVHDAVVAAGYDRSFELLPPDGPRGSAPPLRRRRSHRRNAHRARARRAARSRRHRQGLRGRARSDAPRRGRALPRQRRRRHRVRGGAGRSVSRRRRRAHARAGQRRARHLGPRPPPLAARRRRASPPHRSRDGRTRRERPPPRDGRRRATPSRPRSGRRRSSSPAREPRPAEADAARPSLRARHRGRRDLPRRRPAHERSDLLDPRARERADRLRAAHAVRCSPASSSSRGRSAGRSRQPRRSDVHRFLTLLALGASGSTGSTLVLDATVQISARRAARPRARRRTGPLWTGPRRGRRRARGARRRLVPAAQADRRARWRRLHWATYGVFAARHGPRPRGRHRLAPALGRSASTSARSARVAFATAWRALSPSRLRPPTKGAHRCTGS